ncbi:hypothetical protein MBLNU230_g2357t1 [Neophaeotheca triangularis]
MAVINVDVPDSHAVQAIRVLRANWYLFMPVFVFLRFLYRRYASPLRQYPGPFLASGSRAWKVISTYKGHTETDHINLHAHYGPIVRIAPNELSLSSPQAAREILAAGKGFHKTDFYAVFPPPENPDIFTETRESVHGVKKRYASNAYSMSSMQSLSPCFEETQKALTAKLNAMATSPTQYCNLGDWLHYFAFDVLGEIAFSRNFGFLATGTDVENAIKTIDDMQWYDGLIGQIPEFDFLFRRNPLWKLVPWLNSSNFLITRMALDEVAKRKTRTQPPERKDILTHLLTSHEKAPENFTPGDVFAIAHGAIFAGSDSTASTMQSFCHHVLRSPTIYKTLVHEILNAGLSPCPTWNEVQALPYFQACLKETMRLRPAVGLNITRLVPKGGAEVDGRMFPGGTRVAVNAWVLHRDRGTFGEDCGAFRPERWLGEDEGRIRGMERFMFQFGGGSHLCIGKNLALLEMNKTLPMLFRDYEFELLRPDGELKHHSTFFVVQSGLEVRIARRAGEEKEG